MLLFEPLLQRVKLPVLEKSFNGKQLCTVSLHRKHRARLDCLSVKDDGASAAITGVTADVRAGQSQRFADEVNQEKPGFRIGFSLPAIDFDVNRLLFCHSFSPDRSRLLFADTLHSAG
jgi:hypothetical protein